MIIALIFITAIAVAIAVVFVVIHSDAVVVSALTIMLLLLLFSVMLFLMLLYLFSCKFLNMSLDDVQMSCDLRKRKRKNLQKKVKNIFIRTYYNLDCVWFYSL